MDLISIVHSERPLPNHKGVATLAFALADIRHGLRKTGADNALVNEISVLLPDFHALGRAIMKAARSAQKNKLRVA